jgi:transposase
VPHDGGGAIPNQLETEGMAVTIVDTWRPVTGGVDTHLDVHVAAALDGIGGLLGVEQFKTTAAGNKALLVWLGAFGTPVRVGVEGTGSYGAGLARYLRRAGVEVLEVDRPNRQVRRRKGKTDTVDAIEAARAAQAERQLGQAKTRDGQVEAIRALVVAKRSAKSSRIQTMNQIRHLGFTAPEEIRQSLHGLSRKMPPRKAAVMRPRAASDPVVRATKTALRTLGQRALALQAEMGQIDVLLGELIRAHWDDLLEVYGVGIDTAAALLVAAGDNPERLHSEAAWAHLCGVAPIEASTGKVTRLRLNRGGDRQANSALWHIVTTRMSSDPRTRAYVERRTKEGKSKKEIIRVLKRYVARDIYYYLPRL